MMRSAVWEGNLELAYILHSSEDEWNRYVSSGWHAFYQWARQHPDDAEVIQAVNGSHRSQEMYVKYRRKYERHVMLVLQRSMAESKDE